MKNDYKIIRSDRRTLSLEITEDALLIVRAPKRCTAAYIKSFVESKESWIQSPTEKPLRRARARPEPTEEELAQFRQRAEREIPPLVERYALAMGLRPAGIKITGARKRFGSCSSKDRLCFSSRLMQYPLAAVEYVVVHELAHLVHRNHGKDFYALIASVLPDYKQRGALLKK